MQRAQAEVRRLRLRVAEISGQKLGDAVGLTQFGVNLLRLPPGAWSSQRHWHEGIDEIVIMLDGDVAHTLGAILREELHVESEILAMEDEDARARNAAAASIRLMIVALLVAS